MDTGNQTIAGVKTFSSAIVSDVTGNAGTVTNGVYTSSSVTALSDVSSVGSGDIITLSVIHILRCRRALADVSYAGQVAAASAVLDSDAQTIAGL